MLDDAAIAQGFWRALHGQQSWETALHSIVRRLNSRFAELVVADPRCGIDHIQTCNITQIGLDEVMRHGVYSPQLNPRIAPAIAAPAGRVLIDDDVLAGRDRSDIGLYRDFLIPCGASEVIIAKLPVSLDGRIAVITTSRARCEGAASAEERAFFGGLLPAISGAVEMAARFGQMEADGMVLALSREEGATFALGLSRRPVAMSSAAEAMLASGTYLIQRQHRIHAAVRHSDVLLSRAIDDITARGGLQRGVRRVVLRSASGDEPPVVAILSPVPSRGTATLSAAAVLMEISTQAVGAEHVAALTDGFGLTHAEAAVVVGLASGIDLRTIARQREVTYDTVRSQLRTAMAKTGTNRQTELVALVVALLR